MENFTFGTIGDIFVEISEQTSAGIIDPNELLKKIKVFFLFIFYFLNPPKPQKESVNKFMKKKHIKNLLANH